MNPIASLVIALVIGFGSGYYICDLRNDKNEAEANVKQVDKDNALGNTITTETEQAKKDSDVTKATDEVRRAAPVKLKCIPVDPPRTTSETETVVAEKQPELTENEIITMCATQYVPTNIVRAIRREADKARRRVNEMRNF